MIGARDSAELLLNPVKMPQCLRPRPHGHRGDVALAVFDQAVEFKVGYYGGKIKKREALTVACKMDKI